MAQTSEQGSKESNQNDITGTIGSTNAPSVATSITAPANATTTTNTITDAAAANVPTTGPITAEIPATSKGQQSEPDDKEYDPSVEALIDDIDDERTLEEEEAMAGDNTTAVQNELDDLKRESEMPIEELLAYYQRMREQEASADGGEEEDDDEEFDDGDEEDEEVDEDEDMVEGDDEVSKKQDSANNVETNGQPTQSSQKQQSGTSNQLQEQQTSTRAQQVNTTLSNSHPSSPSKPSQPNQQLPQQVTDLNKSNTPQDQTDVVPSDRLDRQQSQTPRLDDQNQPTNHQPGVQQHVVEYLDVHQSQDDNQIADAVTNVPSTARHRHSMTEFLVDADSESANIFKTLLDYDLDDSDDLDEDYSYSEDEYIDSEREWRRVIHVGPEHQADVPETLIEYENDLPPYENEDTLVWKCNHEQTKEQIIDYLKQASTIPRRNDISISPASVPKISIDNMRLYRERMQDMGPHSDEPNYENLHFDLIPENLRDVYMSQSRKRLQIDSELEQENAMDGMNQTCVESATNPTINSNRDDNSNSISQDNRPDLSTEEYYHGEEQLLYLLLQCNHNYEEALRRRRLDPFKYYFSEPMSLWSQDECLGFEHGLRVYGKNFRLIRENKVPTRTRAELVAFYYLWKKSERHDVYTNQYKLDRKRSLTHPGITDYMDKFIEDNESALIASSTPTPTPTESTVEINQISNVHQHGNHHPISICHGPEARAALQCTDLSDVISRSSSDPNQISAEGDDNVQDSEILLDSNTAI